MKKGKHSRQRMKAFSKSREWPEPSRGVQTFGISGPHWKEKNYLGSHNKYTTLTKTDEQKKVLGKFTILRRASFMAILGCMSPVGSGLDTLGWKTRPFRTGEESSLAPRAHSWDKGTEKAALSREEVPLMSGLIPEDKEM